MRSASILKHNDKKYEIISIYRFPNGDIYPFLIEFKIILTNIIKSNDNTDKMILGGLNINLLNINRISTTYLEYWTPYTLHNILISSSVLIQILV